MSKNIVVDQQQEKFTATGSWPMSLNQNSGQPLSSEDFVVVHEYPSPMLEIKWLECLAHAVAPAHYASPAFFLEPYFVDKKPFAVLAIASGEVVGILTGVHQNGTVVSGLETRVHIAVDERCDPSKTSLSLMRGVEQESRGAKLAQVYSWRNLPLAPFIRAAYRRREFPGNPVLDLSRGAETLLKQCNSKRRNSIRFAMKSAVEITQATTREEFESFYQIYEQWCTAKQIFQYPKDVEWEAFQTTQSNRRLFIARYEGQIIAGSVFRFFPGGLVEYSRNSSLPEFLRLKPNDLLVWRAVEWACAQGFTHFSMGGNHRFLREFGGEMMPIDRYRKDRTLLHRYDLKDLAKDAARRALQSLPATYEKRVRELLQREKPLGW